MEFVASRVVAEGPRDGRQVAEGLAPVPDRETGYSDGMTSAQPEEPATDRRDGVPALAEVAAEPAEQSVRREREAVGDRPDTGGLVPPDDAQ